MLGLTRRSSDEDTGTGSSWRRLPGSTGARKQLISGRGAILISVLVIAVILLGLPLREWIHQRSEIADAQREQIEAQRRVDNLQHQADLWNNPSYVEKQARKRLHFLFPGEVGYQVLRPGEEDGGGIQPVTRKDQELVGPWYGRLWASLKQADRDARTQAEEAFPHSD